MDIITTIFTALQDIVSNVGTLISDVFQSVVGLIYTPGEAGASGSLTVFGVLMLVAAGVGLFFFALRLIRGFIRLRG